MTTPEPRPAEERRALEVWLPLAEEANARYGWRLGPAALEALVMRALPSLAESRSALAARAILWAAQKRSVDEPRNDSPDRRNQA
ncbi:hypothetical protein K2Z83_00785 [Oscillochloris sp. ZM17-4]|uniref:hypothetical protein n=1 Tax=Oscillochloris sp. ZM17-4 TaxID=2866714 RepID=UPI001C73C2F9|nr:hypothetical protein [Oscillochloris sp. ZM17-4]MBX0326228.1 hypothetical protein [Oscillochloris sp. ZM17-4]